MPVTAEDGREWYKLEEQHPEPDQKVLTLSYLPTGLPVPIPGTIDDTWLKDVGGSLYSLSSVIYWRPATDEEVDEMWDLSNWEG